MHMQSKSLAELEAIELEQELETFPKLVRILAPLPHRSRERLARKALNFFNHILPVTLKQTDTEQGGPLPLTVENGAAPRAGRESRPAPDSRRDESPVTSQ